MGLSKHELKLVVKETVQELLGDKDFVEMLMKKLSDKINQLEKTVNIGSEQIASLERKVGETESQQAAKMVKIKEAVSKNIQEITKLENRVDQLQQNEKLANICVYGLTDAPEEDLPGKVINMVKNYIKTDIKTADIISCFRVGNYINNKIRPTVVKFQSREVRNSLLIKCRSLKGTRMGLAEDLTKKRHLLYKKVQETFERKNVFTRNGNIFVKIGEAKHRVSTEEDICSLKRNRN